jgi:hypothetical protein
MRVPRSHQAGLGRVRRIPQLGSLGEAKFWRDSETISQLGLIRVSKL